MKLHKDGTLEGTPQEIAEYMKLKDPMFGKLHLPLEGTTSAPKSPYPSVAGTISMAKTAHN